MFEIHLDHWSLSPELRLLLDIVLRKKPQIPEGVDWDAFEAALCQHRLQVSIHPSTVCGSKTALGRRGSAG